MSSSSFRLYLWVRSGKMLPTRWSQAVQRCLKQDGLAVGETQQRAQQRGQHPPSWPMLGSACPALPVPAATGSARRWYLWTGPVAAWTAPMHWPESRYKAALLSVWLTLPFIFWTLVFVWLTFPFIFCSLLHLQDCPLLHFLPSCVTDLSIHFLNSFVCMTSLAIHFLFYNCGTDLFIWPSCICVTNRLIWPSCICVTDHFILPSCICVTDFFILPSCVLVWLTFLVCLFEHFILPSCVLVWLTFSFCPLVCLFDWPFHSALLCACLTDLFIHFMHRRQRLDIKWIFFQATHGLNTLCDDGPNVDVSLKKNNTTHRVTTMLAVRSQCKVTTIVPVMSLGYRHSKITGGVRQLQLQLYYWWG